MGQLVPNATLNDFTKLYQDQRAYGKQIIQYMLPIWPHFANGHWDRCTVQEVWMGQLDPNYTFIDFTKLYQDHRSYAKQVIQYNLPNGPIFQMVIGIGVLFKGSGLVNLLQMIA